MKVFDLSINDHYMRSIKAATITQALEQVPAMAQAINITVYDFFACAVIDGYEYELSLLDQ